MIKNYKRWSKEEDKYLLDQVSKSPKNLQTVFQKVSIKLNRTNTAVAEHYYFLRRTNKINHICFTLIGSNTHSINSKKESIHYKEIQNSTSLWKRIKNFLGF